jgi:hypothetical protein
MNMYANEIVVSLFNLCMNRWQAECSLNLSESKRHLKVTDNNKQRLTCIFEFPLSYFIPIICERYVRQFSIRLAFNLDIYITVCVYLPVANRC